MPNPNNTIEINPVFTLIVDARNEYARRMLGRHLYELPDRFEDYVFAICQVARELREVREYDRTSTAPSDVIMRRWYAVQKRHIV